MRKLFICLLLLAQPALAEPSRFYKCLTALRYSGAVAAPFTLIFLAMTAGDRRDRDDLESVYLMDGEYHATFRSVAESMDELLRHYPQRDEWERRVRRVFVEGAEGREVQLSSPGSDKKWDTPDDLFIRYKL